MPVLGELWLTGAAPFLVPKLFSCISIKTSPQSHLPILPLKISSWLARLSSCFRFLFLLDDQRVLNFTCKSIMHGGLRCFLAALAALQCASIHVSASFARKYTPNGIAADQNIDNLPCVSVTRRCTYTNSPARMRRSGHREVSMSPEIGTPSIPSSNSTKAPAPQAPRGLPSWFPTLETVITAVFRAVITVLSLFNVKITWRIHD